MAVKEGDSIKVHYVGRFEDGEVFDTSRKDVAEESGVYDERRDYEPLEFEVGAGEVVEGFDEGVVGMEEGETREIEVSPEDGYGEHNDEYVADYDYDEFEEAIGQEPEVGMHLHLDDEHGDIVDIEDGTVYVDYNHPLAGKSLVFEVELIEA